MLVLAVGVEERVVHLERALEVEGLDVQDLICRNFRLRATHDGCELVDGSEALFDLLQFTFFRYQVALVQYKSISKSHLFHRFVLGTLRLLIIEVLHHVLRVDHGDDGVQLELGLALRLRRDLLLGGEKVGDEDMQVRDYLIG